MQPNSTEQQERIDSKDSASPSAGWREVYTAMGVSPSGDADEQTATTRARNSTEDTGRVPKPNDRADSASANS